MVKTQEDATVKKSYQKQRDDFKKKRDKILRQIKGKLGEVSDLEKVIAKARPSILGGVDLCPRCDIISLEPRGKKDHPGYSDHRAAIYVCKICGYNNLKPTFKDYTDNRISGVGYNKRAREVV